MEQDILYHKLERKGYRPRNIIYAPETLRQKVVQAAHLQIDAGHGGGARTTDRVLSTYWWPGVTTDVTKFVKECPICATTKARATKPAPLQSLPICVEPNTRVHLDLFGPLKISEGGNKYILVITDAFTKYTEVVAIENKEAETVARAFFERWICRFSAPQQIVTDQGKEFCNKILDLTCELWGIDKNRTSPFHPQTNSSAESYNRTIIKYMRAMLGNNNTLGWEQWLAPLMLAYNCHVHRATLETPFFLTHLHDPRLPHFDISNPRRLYHDNYAAEAYNLVQVSYRRAAENLGKAQKAQKHYYDRKTEEKSFKADEKVLVHFPNVPTGINPKFYTRWRLCTMW
jgi:hypothetical protein